MDVTSEAFALVGQKIEATNATIGDALLSLGLREQVGSRVSVELPSLGISVGTDLDGAINVVHLYADGVDGYSQFPLRFRGIGMDSSKERVRQALAPALEQGEGSSDGNLPPSGGWDVYRVGGVRVHIEFFRNVDKIRLVTLTAADLGNRWASSK